MNKGLLIVISGPAGSGKGTVVKKIIEKDDSFVCSISATTRKKRNGEVDGVNYFFIQRGEFLLKAENGDMLEYAEYVGNYYGTPRDFVTRKLEEGKNVILEIEVVGAMKIKDRLPGSILIFYSPPTVTELEKRLKERGTEDDETIRKRMKKADTEVMSLDNYDYLVISMEDMVEKSADEIIAITKAEQCKRQKDKFIDYFYEKGSK